MNKFKKNIFYIIFLYINNAVSSCKTCYNYITICIVILENKEKSLGHSVASFGRDMESPKGTEIITNLIL
jgi:hypothetical protein